MGIERKKADARRHRPFYNLAVFQFRYWKDKWAHEDSNLGPRPYQGRALNQLSYAPDSERPSGPSQLETDVLAATGVSPVRPEVHGQDPPGTRQLK